MRAIADRVKAGGRAPRFTIARKKALSTSIRKCAPIQGRPSGKAAVNAARREEQPPRRKG